MLFIFGCFHVCYSGLVGVHVCAVYRLGPRSWKPDASLPQTVAELDVEQTCRLSHAVLMSEMLESTDDASQMLRPADDRDQSSSHPATQSNNSNSNAAEGGLQGTKPTKDTPSSRRCKLTWSASGGIRQSLADDDDDTELVLSQFVVCGTG